MAALKLTKRMIICSVCRRPASKKKLYKCLHCFDEDCEEIYCKRCGEFSHKDNDDIDHEFDLNADHIEEVAFDKESKALAQGLGKVDSALTTYDEQEYGHVRQTYFGAIGGGLSSGGVMIAVKTGLSAAAKSVTSVTATTTTSTVMGTVGDLAADGTQIVQAAAQGGTEVAQVAVKGATEVGKATVGQTMTNTFGATIGTAAIGAGIGAAVMAGFEITLHSYRYWNGPRDIEAWKEYKYNIKRGLTASLGMGLGNWGGTVIGATLGSIGGPIGAIIGGILGGIIGGLVGAKAGRSAFEHFSPDDFIYTEQKKKEEDTRAALRLFGWMDINVINDEKRFNENTIRKEYRRLAKQYHPDRNGGTPESHANFHTLNASLGCLLALVRKKNKKEIIKILQTIPAISYQKNIERAERILRQKNLFYIVNVCHDYDAELTLEALCQYRMNDVLELIDEMNADEGNSQRISVRKKK
eukprot:299062_1